MNEQEFIIETSKIGIIITDDQLRKLHQFYELLIEWNGKINLTRITDKQEVYLKHFYDSLTLIKVIDLNKDLSLLDVGSGAGFPGIVLKIVFPNLKVVLLDALQKRVNYLNIVIETLKLKDIEAVHDRCEDYVRANYEKFDFVTARAVANLRVLAELCVPAVKVNGFFLPMKAFIAEEIIESKEILKKLDCEIEYKEVFSLPIENSTRTLLRIIKKSKTNRQYPRNFNKIKNFN